MSTFSNGASALLVISTLNVPETDLPPIGYNSTYWAAFEGDQVFGGVVQRADIGDSCAPPLPTTPLPPVLASQPCWSPPG